MDHESHAKGAARGAVFLFLICRASCHFHLSAPVFSNQYFLFFPDCCSAILSQCFQPVVPMHWKEILHNSRDQADCHFCFWFR